MVPQGVHNWDNFVTPSDLNQILIGENCRISRPIGMAYNPFMNKWSWTNFIQVNYALAAFKL